MAGSGDSQDAGGYSLGAQPVVVLQAADGKRQGVAAGI